MAILRVRRVTYCHARHWNTCKPTRSCRNKPGFLDSLASPDMTVHHPSVCTTNSSHVIFLATIFSFQPQLGAQWLCGRVADLQSGGCRFESQPGLLRTKVYSAFHPSGVGKLSISCGWEGKGRYGSFRLRMNRVGVQVKLKYLENTCHT